MMRIFRSFVIISTAIFSVINTIAYFPASYPLIENPCWSFAANMPTARVELAGVASNEKAYLIAGYTDKPIDTMEVYDPINDQWSVASPLPEKLDHLAAAAHDGKIYVVGGFTEDSSPSDKLFIYDTATDEWKEGANMPTARGALTAEFVEGLLYAVGGDGNPANIDGSYDPSGQVSTNEAYNPETDSWTEKAPMPTPRLHHVSAVIDEKVYVIGGRQGVSPSSHKYNNTGENEMYDPKKNLWVSLEPMPTPRSGAAATSVNGSIYVLGGESNNYPKGKDHTYNTNEKYDAAADKWTSEPPMTISRHGLSAVAINGTIYAIGGGKEPGSTTGDANEKFHVDSTGDRCL